MSYEYIYIYIWIFREKDNRTTRENLSMGMLQIFKLQNLKITNGRKRHTSLFQSYI